eukprot:5604518-Pyramimonas_sp.AAC.1
MCIRDRTILNSANYGVPRDRERVHYVCLRSDIEGSHSFEWPQPVQTPSLAKFLDRGVKLSITKSQKRRINAALKAIKKKKKNGARSIIDAANGRGPHF